MPRRPNTPCKHPGCPALVPYGQDYCDEHAPLHKHDRDSAGERGYDARWRRARRIFLQQHPLCVKCLEEKKMSKATVVDHILPHRGDPKLFWDQTNWQPLCKKHHDQKTMTDDRYQEYKY